MSLFCAVSEIQQAICWKP